jgi:cell division septal protein FtsQ
LIFGLLGFAALTVLTVLHVMRLRSFSLEGVERVTVVGNHLLSAREVLTLAGFPENPRSQTLRPSAMRAALMEHRFVSNATVNRQGKTVVFRTSELRPYFRMVAGDNKYWLCRDGEIVPMDVQNDFGMPFDELRKQVSLRLAGMQLVEDDPAMLALIVYAAIRLEDVLPRQVKEMRVDLRRRCQLILHDGITVKLGALEYERAKDLADKLSVLEKTVRAARNSDRPVREIEFRDPTHAVLVTGGA